MPLALQKYRPKVNVAASIDRIVNMLEKLMDEKFWHSLLGDRITNLMKRYFGNDFVMITLLIYIAPILRTNWRRLLDYMLNRSEPVQNTLTVEIHKEEEMYDVIDEYIKDHIDNDEEKLTGMAKYTRTHRAGGPEIGIIPHGNDTNVLYHNGRKLFVTWRQTGDDRLPEILKDTHIEISLDGEPGETVEVVQEILQEWSDSCNAREVEVEDEVVTINHNEWNGTNWIYKGTIEPRSVDSVNLAPGVKEGLMTDISRFLSQKSWFLKRGIPFRRGILFYGPPGTGKSSIIQALAGHLQLNLATMKLTEVASDSEFGRGISKMAYRSMLVIEDIDHCQLKKVTMSSVLNALDGLNSKDGAIVVMTCNDLNKLEPALLRPGRIDIKVKLDYAVHSQMISMFWRFFDLGNQELHKMKLAEAEANQEAKKVMFADECEVIPSNKPISPPMTDDDDDDAYMERRAHLEQTLNKLMELIPENTVTTAELQGLFTGIILEMGPDCDHQTLMQALLDRVDEFLKQAEFDRQQAVEHKKHLEKEKEREKEEADEKKATRKKKKAQREESESDDDFGFGLFD
ncbi:P-loop containing nucleoside triphosphate hydrolase protein [Gongronella butleri]|nr:P-loop containing nucleoside triphosphate hydrolase protein [Gongronella butleri]